VKVKGNRENMVVEIKNASFHWGGKDSGAVVNEALVLKEIAI
jgi:hypothetical protein